MTSSHPFDQAIKEGPEIRFSSSSSFWLLIRQRKDLVRVSFLLNYYQLFYLIFKPYYVSPFDLPYFNSLKCKFFNSLFDSIQMRKHWIAVVAYVTRIVINQFQWQSS